MNGEKPAHPPIGDPGFDSIVLQHLAAILSKSTAEIAAEQKAFDKRAPELRSSIEAKEQITASIHREIAALQDKLSKNRREIEADKQQMQSMCSKLDALKARDPFQQFRHALPHTGLKPTSSSTQQPASTPGDDSTCEPRPHKRRRTADEDIPPERTVDFGTIFGNGRPTHFIIEHPKKSRNWYIVECLEHSQRFDNTRSPLRSAMHHIRGKLHKLERNADVAIRELGSRVVGCDEDQVKKNNDAFTPTTTPQSRQPRLSEVYRPQPGRLYLGRWGTRGNTTWYAVVVLPHDDLKPIGMDGTLRDTGLLSGSIPACYEVRDQTIVGWEKGYEDDGVAVSSRKFPLLWLQDNVNFTFRDGRLQVPTQQCFSWLPATKLRPFHDSGPDGEPVVVPRAVRDFFQQPVSNQAPLANMDPSASAGGIAEWADADRESDKDYVHVPEQESDDDSEDEWDMGPEEVARAHTDMTGQSSGFHSAFPPPTELTGQSSIAVDTQKPSSPEGRQTQPPPTRTPNMQPPQPMDSIHALQQNLGPGPVSNPEISSGHAPTQKMPSSHAPQSPCTPKSPSTRPAGPTPLQYAAAMAQQTMYHRLGLTPNSPKPVGSTASHVQNLQKQGQQSPGMTPNYNEARPSTAQPQREQSTVDTARHFGTMYPGPNQMAFHQQARKSWR